MHIQIKTSMKHLITQNKKGFTIIELLVVMAIIVILAAILFPAVMRARLNTNEFLAVKGLRSLCQALELYRIDNGDYPDTAEDLINSHPPYVQNPAIVQAATAGEIPYVGYYFDYTKTEPMKYTYTASPKTIGATGTKTFTVDEDGEIEE
ncbi:MAG: prepilin-type N-terminal cleavage/methylation domain-containing protein [Candidatus Omnitrophota bacterium]